MHARQALPAGTPTHTRTHLVHKGRVEHLGAPRAARRRQRRHVPPAAVQCGHSTAVTYTQAKVHTRRAACAACTAWCIACLGGAPGGKGGREEGAYGHVPPSWALPVMSCNRNRPAGAPWPCGPPCWRRWAHLSMHLGREKSYFATVESNPPAGSSGSGRPNGQANLYERAWVETPTPAARACVCACVRGGGSGQEGTQDSGRPSRHVDPMQPKPQCSPNPDPQTPNPKYDSSSSSSSTPVTTSHGLCARNATLEQMLRCTLRMRLKGLALGPAPAPAARSHTATSPASSPAARCEPWPLTHTQLTSSLPGGWEGGRRQGGGHVRQAVSPGLSSRLHRPPLPLRATACVCM